MQLELTLPARAETRSRKCSSWDLMRDSPLGLSDAGVPVSPHLAENLSAVFASVQLVAQTIASLPIIVYRRDAKGSRFEDRRHAVARLFAGDVNEHQTAADFFEMMQAHCLYRGNAYAEVIRDQRGQPVELIPLHPEMVSVLRVPRSKRVVYDVTDWEGGATRRLLQEEMLHLKDRSDDGIVGKSRLARARESFGSALATEEFAARMFRNQAQLSGVLQTPHQLSEQSLNHLKNDFKTLFQGTRNAGAVAVLEEDLKRQAISVSPEDAQMLESRRFSVESVCRMFGVPPQLVGDTSKSAYSNVVEASRHFARFTLMPWAAKWEQTLGRSLFGEIDRATHEIEVNLDELLRGDPLQRAQTWRIMREIGAVSANEVRAEEGWNPRSDPGGNEFLSPLNMMPEQQGKPADRDP